MIQAVLCIYTKLLLHYKEKWRKDAIDSHYLEWEQGQEMREDFGYDDRNFRRIPKRKIKNNAARRKHGY